MKTTFTFSLMAFLLLMCQGAFSQDVHYVKSGPVNGDGLSWATASNNLQQTINNAASFDEIWVAEGTYQPPAGQAFHMKERVSMYGGFPATGNPQRADRNFAAYTTILSGNGNRVIENLGGISYSTVLDGFTIANGNATDGLGGGGMRNVTSYPDVYNCIFKNNTTTARGGAVSNLGLNDYKSETFYNCLFYGNSASGGGAIEEYAMAGSFINCTVANNHALGNGGGFIIFQNPNIAFYNCVVSGNTASGSGQQFQLSNNGYIGWYNSICPNDAFNVSNGYLGSFNSINGDPLFVDAANNDFRLQPTSPAINTGDAGYLPPNDGGRDLAFNPRIDDGQIDMGVYEAFSCNSFSIATNTSRVYVAPGNSVTLSASGAVTYTWSPATGLDTTTGDTVVASPSVSTTYTVTGTSQGGCTATKTIRVIVSAMPVHYIRAGAVGGDGESWATADGDLAAAMNAAGYDEEVWVAAGDYTAPQGQSFNLNGGANVYGGFPSTGDPGMADRNWNENKTFLHGNGNSVVSCYFVGNCKLDGFIISDGAAYNGGGMNNFYSTPTVSNCIITANVADNWGGGLYNENGHPRLINTLISFNSAGGGGGSFDYNDAQTEYRNVTFAFNQSGGNGGALHTYVYSDITGYNCIFWGNTAAAGTNDIASVDSSSAKISTSIIDESLVGGPFEGTDNINADPLFSNSQIGDFTLRQGSPAIDSGSNAEFDAATYPKDLGGNDRVFNINIDRGAYESKGLQECSIATTWDGVSWTNGTPNTFEYNATIAGDFSSTSDLTACSLTVTSGTVTVNPTHVFNIMNGLIVNAGSLTFENNSYLLQQGNYNLNSGNITYKRDTNIRRQEYTYWSSPVADQNLHNFSPLTVNTRFYGYNENTNTFPPINPLVNDFIPAKGYMVRAPNTYADYPAAPQLWTGKFIGVPNNGDYVVPVTHNGDGFNMLGNPYPSQVNAYDFLSQNPGTLYFWAHINFSTTVSNYATFNFSGATAAAAGGETPNGNIQAGQGFLYQTGIDRVAAFMNYMRSNVSDTPFYRTGQVHKDRLWLNLATGNENSSQMLVCYTSAATSGVDENYDGKLIQGGNSISSLIDDTAYVIQARPSFTITDEVPLSLKATTAGTYTISLDHVDGNFDTQDIFLADSQTNTIQNLKTGAYSFVSETGTFNNRFKIVYQNSLLGVADPVASTNDVAVYKKNRNIMIDSGKMEITAVDVFDISGRLVYSDKNVNATTAMVQNLQLEEQVLVVKITESNGQVISKKIVY